jgi:uncharacterized phage protein gp47/JayE
MPITYPANRQEVIDRIKTDVQTELPTADPFIRNSAISAICVGYGGASYDLNVNQQNLQKELFPNTADGEYAQRWGTLKNITFNPAQASTGYISITGNAGITIAASNIVLQNSTGIIYQGQDDVTITQRTINISSIIRDSSIATVTTYSAHNLGSGDSVTISGAVQIEYNITATVLVIDDTHFSYSITGTPASPATGVIIGITTNAIAEIICNSTGEVTNLSNGAALSFSTTIAGVNSVAHVTANGLIGGTNAESDASYRQRYLIAYQHPFSLFNDSSIESFIKQNNYVLKIWIFDITPNVGQVTIYFTVLDNNGFSAIPSPLQVTTIKKQIIDYNTGIKPANTDPADIIVSAPTPIPVTFTFTTLTPNDESMQNAIYNSLQQVFGEKAEVGENFPQYAYESAIYQTINPLNGEKVSSFTLSSPIGDIIIGTGQLAVLNGRPTYP